MLLSIVEENYVDCVQFAAALSASCHAESWRSKFKGTLAGYRADARAGGCAEAAVIRPGPAEDSYPV
jgi:hypothetical protein